MSTPEQHDFSPNAAIDEQTKRPDNRLTEEEKLDLQLIDALDLADDTRHAMERNFPPEQLPDWQLVRTRLKERFIALHELRSKSTGELLSSRMIVDYPSRFRGEPQFLLVAFVVTPDGDGSANTKQNKSKGYGSYLRGMSLELSRRQKPNALGLVAERESTAGAKSVQDQTVRRASWMSRIGLFVVEGISYDIPPLLHSAEAAGLYIPVAQRTGEMKPADLLIYRFDGKKIISGKHLKSLVGRLYVEGYSISPDDPFFVTRIEQVKEDRDYQLVSA